MGKKYFFTPDVLLEVAQELFRAAGSPDEEAELVARLLVGGNLS